MYDERDPTRQPQPDDAHEAASGTVDATPDGPVEGHEATAEESAAPQDLEEVDVLRRELSRLADALEAARQEAAEAQERALRARADFENLRRRAVADTERAHGAGLDAALRPVLTVHDDLERAVVAAREGSDPSAILPGVEAVLASLERQLEALGVSKTGAVGETFDARLHDALTAVPAPSPELAGTIQAVYEAGFVQGDRLVRPARVVVYQEA